MGCTGTLVVGSPGQPGEALLLENAGDADGAEFVVLLVEQVLNIVDGEILFAGLNDPVAQRIGFGCLFGTFGWWNKKTPLRILAELVNQNAETACGVAETEGSLFGRDVIDKEGAERLILAMGGIGGLKKDLREICYLFVFIVKHTSTLSRCSGCVKLKYKILCRLAIDGLLGWLQRGFQPEFLNVEL